MNGFDFFSSNVQSQLCWLISWGITSRSNYPSRSCFRRLKSFWYQKFCTNIVLKQRNSQLENSQVKTSFPSCVLPLSEGVFQPNHSCENDFRPHLDFHSNQDRFSAETRFETEATVTLVENEFIFYQRNFRLSLDLFGTPIALKTYSG